MGKKKKRPLPRPRDGTCGTRTHPVKLPQKEACRPPCGHEKRCSTMAPRGGNRTLARAGERSSAGVPRRRPADRPTDRPNPSPARASPSARGPSRPARIIWARGGEREAQPRSREPARRKRKFGVKRGVGERSGARGRSEEREGGRGVLERVCPCAPTATPLSVFCWLAACAGLLVGTAVSSSLRLAAFCSVPAHRRVHFFQLFFIGSALKFLGVFALRRGGAEAVSLLCAGRK